MIPNERLANNEQRWSSHSIQFFLAGMLALTAIAQRAQQPPSNRAQSTDPTRPLTISAVDPATYVIRPNDTLLVSAIEPRWASGMTVITCLVRSDGTIRLPTIKPIRAEGLTLAQFRKQLAKALSLKEADVTVTPDRPLP